MVSTHEIQPATPPAVRARVFSIAAPAPLPKAAVSPALRRRSAALAAVLALVALLATGWGLSWLKDALWRESSSAAWSWSASSSSSQHQQQQQHAAAAIALYESERAALGPAARVAAPVDPAALRAAHDSGDPQLAALARDLDKAFRAGWPLAVARAQMRAALDAASAALTLRAAAEADAQDAEERRALEEQFEAAAKAEAEAAANDKKVGRAAGGGGAGKKKKSGRRRSAAPRRWRKRLPTPAPAAPPPPPRLIVREHAKGWRFAQRVAALLAERAAEAAGSRAPIPCGDGGSGDPTLPGLPAAAAPPLLLAVTMSRDLDSGSAASAASARNAAWQAARLAAGAGHGRLAVAVSVLLEPQQPQQLGSKGGDSGKRPPASSSASASAARARAAQAAEASAHLRAAAALLRLALAPLGVECRAVELRDDGGGGGAGGGGGGGSGINNNDKRQHNATAVMLAALAGVSSSSYSSAGWAGGGPQPPFVGRGAALARNAAVDAFFSPSKAAATTSRSPSFGAVLFADARAFFCAEDALRLASYPSVAAGGGVDLACALPLVDDDEPSVEGAGGGGGAASSAASASPSSSVFAASQARSSSQLHSDVPSRLRLRSLRADGAADAARDVRGSALSPLPPFVVHADSAALARQGQPFPVRCCWGGLARLSAWPLRRGLRFRVAAGVGGGADGGKACARPYHEASTLCDDLHGLSSSGGGGAAGGGVEEEDGREEDQGGGGGGGRGLARAVLDPAVRTSTQARVRRALAHRRFPYYYYTRLEVGTWARDVAPLLRGKSSGTGGTSSSGSGFLFWPAPGKPAVGGMWQPSMSRVACCEAPLLSMSEKRRPDWVADCRQVKATTLSSSGGGGGEGGGGGGGRGGLGGLFGVCRRGEEDGGEDSRRAFCPGAALALARRQTGGGGAAARGA
jgi:hypothetical protein